MLILLNSLWFGILTSISPCPLANNIAIISYLSKNTSNIKKSIMLSFIYTLGRMFFYTSLGMILSFSINQIGLASLFLQKQMNIVLGFVLILVGLIILDIIKFNIKTIPFCENLKERCKNCGYLGTFLLGVLFASAFCPVSAGLFFGNLIQNKGNLFAFLLYGFGTGLPVILVSLVLLLTTNKIASIYKGIGIFEKYSTKITGIIFILVGIYILFNYLDF